LAQGGGVPRPVSRVARQDIRQHLVFPDLDAVLRKLQEAAAGALFWGGGDEQLHVGIGADHGADVAPVDDGTPGRRRRGRGEGALELADTVIEACNDENDFKFLYPLEMKLRDRVEIIAKEVYGAAGVDWQPEAEAKAKMLEDDPKYADFATMMVKTHLSLSHDPVRKGVPTGWALPIRDVLIYSGAKFLCPCAGTISLMPGTSSNPAFRRVDVDVETGKVSGLF